MKTLLKSVAGVALSAAWLAAPCAALASAQGATDYGCVNCHGAYPRGEAPSFERLAGKMAKYKGDDAALAQKVAKYRMGEPLEHIDAHERISADTATQLLRWLAEGAR